jgi:ketosteroid isomerase-like protein
MGTTAPIQRALTGEEDMDDLSQPLQALVQFYRAFSRRDWARMKQKWDDSPKVRMANPLGGVKPGWSEIRSVYQRIFNGWAKGGVEFFDYTVHIIGDGFYAVGRERGRSEGDGTTLDLAMRTTRVFRRVEGLRWRQIHHHGSFEDPEL